MKRSVLAVALAALLGAAPVALAQQRSADTSASALHWAAYDNDLGAVRRLLDEGADPNAV
ncbi:MAG TPA: ankyrin repeat domain-containing protein, partial [Gammaproteobacteria bacterium]|nr:ankyrin repeat domain-containing protein [Gammaproteobacteria bacterium]